MTRQGILATAIALAVVGPAIMTAVPAASADGPAPLLMAPSGGIPNRYIVVLKGLLPTTPTQQSEQGDKAEDAAVASAVDATPTFDYDAAIRGFAADLTEGQVQEIRGNPDVAYVEQDARVTADDVQTDAPWSLDRIDQRSLPLNGTYDSSSTAGAGVTAYVLDTGLEASNPDFSGRASNALDTVDTNPTDCNGHGTHVAGTIGGTKYGVAKLVHLVGIKVLNCGGVGPVSSLIQGIDWVTAHHASESIANMSLGGGATAAVDAAVSHLIESGVFVSVAAGNNNQNACNFSPARASGAFTVAASDSGDAKASFSNWGPCVAGYAPGVDVPSDWITGVAVKAISGTSMAAPAVAGVAALYLADHPGSPPSQTGTWIRDDATKGVIKNGSVDGTPDFLLYKAGL